MLKAPMVIWQGTEPLHKKGSFRLVYRGPARPDRPDDVPFSIEQKLGVNAMKAVSWGPVKEGSRREALWALSHALGLLLTMETERIDLNHPLYCEVNMAVAEKRDARGCDDDRSPDPVIEMVFPPFSCSGE